ncbi:MAG: hypothetical protein Q9208_008287 [Pyrenodesmia sp. 3 TL-2023]
MFNPTHLYVNIYGYWVKFWTTSEVTPITNVLYLDSHWYPALGTTIEPISGNNRLTTAVAQAVLGLMLRKLTNWDTELSPALFEVTLATRGLPSIPIGRIRNTFRPGLNTPVIDDTDTSTNKTSILSDNGIRVRLEFNGHDPRYPRTTPKVWLNSFTRLSVSIFSRLTDSDLVPSDRIHASLVALSDEEGPNYRLIFQIVSRPIPAANAPLVWGEVTAGLLLILQKVIREQKFESFNAAIYKDGWVAATCAYCYAPKRSNGQGNGATA